MLPTSRFSVWLLPAASSGPDGGLHLEFGSGLRACCAKEWNPEQLRAGSWGRRDGVSIVNDEPFC